MLQITNFDTAPVAKYTFYGGNAGAKEAIVYNDYTWMVKYPKTTRDLLNPQISYTTSPLSEYIGSKIYEVLGIPVHETILGIRKNKVVVACKDFTKNKVGQGSMVDKAYLIPFHDLKNNFMSSDIDEYSGTGSETLLEEVLATINGQDSLKAIPGVMERFWDMFVIDAFIGNNDRNNGNWGILIDAISREISLAPVYDNGNAFFNKRGISQMQKRLGNTAEMKDDAYNIACAFKYTGLDNEGHKINPFDFIKEGENKDCIKAVARFVNAVDMVEVESVINNIPEQVGMLAIMPQGQKDFYVELLRIRLSLIEEGLK